MARQDFISQLIELGYEPEDRGDGKICFNYRVEVGSFIGKGVTLGFTVGDDFPLSCPTGPRMSPRLLPINSGGKHPEGGVHECAEYGPEWEYWSRPFHGWNNTNRTVKAYLTKHIRQLFATQKAVPE